MYYLYAYTSPSGKKYIGITDCVKRRQSEHAKKEHGSKNNTTKFAKAIRKYGYNNFTFEILDTSKDRETIEKLEIHYIELFDSINNGYNITSGGSYGVAPRKLSKDVVIAIDKDLSEGILSYGEISEKYKISPAMINKIKNRMAWSSILGDKIDRKNLYRKKEKNPAAKITQEIADEIRSLLSSGVSRLEIKNKFSISKSLIQQIATNKIWKKQERGAEKLPPLSTCKY